MIIFHSQKFVYIRSQKTASTSIQELLSYQCNEKDTIFNCKHSINKYKNLNNKIQIKYCNAETDHASIDYVINNFPDVKNYTFITSVRNPIDIELSRFRYHGNKGNFKNKLKSYLSNEKYNQEKYYFSNLKNIDFYIKVENLKEDLKELYSKMNWNLDYIPELNTTKKNTITLNQEEYNFLKNKYKKIFNYFNY